MSGKDIEAIVELQLEELRRKLGEKNIILEIDKEAKERLAREGYDPDFGARPLRRLIQKEIQDKVAMKLLKGDYREGGKVRISVDTKGRFKFS